MAWWEQIVPMVGPSFEIEAVGRTETGPVRSENQDALRIVPGAEGPRPEGKRERGGSPLWTVVADGMGGHGDGEAASRIAIETLIEIGKSEFADPKRISFPQAWRSFAPFAAEEIVGRLEQEIGSEESMGGTTLTALLFVGNFAGLFHVGDSVLYRYNSGRLKQISEDQSYVGRLVREGKLSPDEARMHPKRNVVENALTSNPSLTHQPQGKTFSIKPGDSYLIASDGLTDGLDENEITTLLQRSEKAPIADALDQLIDRSLARSGRDNTTAILVRVHGA